jgi:proteasome lid subunit RPN8/RPN11
MRPSTRAAILARDAGAAGDVGRSGTIGAYDRSPARDGWHAHRRRIGDDRGVSTTIMLVEDDERIRMSMRLALEDEGYELAVVHSHVSAPPRPSRTDVENVGLWQGRPYLIYSVARDELAAWTIADGSVDPLELG